MGNNQVPSLGYPQHFTPPNTPFVAEREQSPVKIHSASSKTIKRGKHACQHSVKNIVSYKTHSSAISTLHQPEQCFSKAPKDKEPLQVKKTRKEGMSLEDRTHKMLVKFYRKEKCKEQYLQRQKDREAKFNVGKAY